MNYKRKPSKEQITALNLMYSDIKGATVAPLEKSNQKQNKLIPIHKMAKTFKEVETKVKKEFKNEVENDYEEIPFFNFENNKTFTGVIFGETKTIKTKDKTSECFIVVDEDEQKYLLPTNVQLTSKITNLLKIKEAEISMGIDIQITNEGLQKIEGVDNKVKVFKVLTT